MDTVNESNDIDGSTGLISLTYSMGFNGIGRLNEKRVVNRFKRVKKINGVNRELLVLWHENSLLFDKMVHRVRENKTKAYDVVNICS